jgi:DNA-binding transcriptional MerR regulator
VVSNRYLSGIHKVSINKTNINKTVLINNGMSINKIDKIVNSKDIDKQTKIIELASVPLPELKQCIDKHPYYVQKAIEYQEQELRDKRSLPKHIVDQRLTAAMKTNAKNRSAAYKAKVAYNKANNIKPWEMKKNKF